MPRAPRTQVYARQTVPSTDRPAVLFQPLDQFRRLLLALADVAVPDELLVLGDGALDAAAGADDGAVVALAHARADLGEAELRGLAHQEHRHAAGQADRPLAAAGHQVLV